MHRSLSRQTEAKEALTNILGPGIPDEVVSLTVGTCGLIDLHPPTDPNQSSPSTLTQQVKELFVWKDRFASTRLGVTGLER